MNSTLVAKKKFGTNLKGWLVAGTLAIIAAGTLGVGSAQPAQAKGMGRHHHKKKHHHHKHHHKM